jgi:transposase InsO family protein
VDKELFEDLGDEKKEEKPPEVKKEDGIGLEECIPNSQVPPGWRAAIRHIHEVLGHPPNATLAKNFSSGGAPRRLVQFVLEWKCPTCAAQKSSQERRKAALPHATWFGEGIASDCFFVTDDRGEETKVFCVYSWIDLAETYHMAVVGAGPNPSAEEHARLFEEHWIKHYGAPLFFVSDPGDEQIGKAMEDLLTFYTCRAHTTPGGAPWKNAVAERHGGTLKGMIGDAGQHGKPGLDCDVLRRGQERRA